MKRVYAVLLSLVVLFACQSASANSWGLTGKLYEAVSKTDKWDEYSTLCKQAGDLAIMRSRYHNVLMYVRDGKLHTYTKAVYQPGEKNANGAELKLTNNGFILSYGKDESYTFQWRDELYRLAEAKVGALSITSYCDPGDTYLRYEAREGNERAILALDMPLERFNIALFPRSLEEVRHINLMRAALDSGLDCLGWWDYGGEPGARVENVGSRTAPVYSAPYGLSAWRAAKGKAAVGLNGELWKLRSLINADGESYTCIRYDVSARTQRIGYVASSQLNVTGITESVEDAFICVEVAASEDTYLTDDPDVSQYAQISVPKGTYLDCLGLYGNEYAYVAGEVKDGKFTDGGAIVWGFVPLKALKLDAQDSLYRGHIAADVMQSMEGEWEFYAGGNMSADRLRLSADGRFTGGYINYDTNEIASETSGEWYVTGYNPRWNLYWNSPEYEITFVYDDGRVNVKGLTLDESGFSLTNWEGGGGYQRIAEEKEDSNG